MKFSEHKQDQTWVVLAFSVKRYISHASAALISSNEGFLCCRPAIFVVDVLFAKPRYNASGNRVLVKTCHLHVPIHTVALTRSKIPIHSDRAK